MEYHKIIYHRKPTELEQLIIQQQLRKDVADATWDTEGDNATPYGFIWHVGFPQPQPTEDAAWSLGWDGFIEDDEPNGFGSQRFRFVFPPYPEIPYLQTEEV